MENSYKVSFKLSNPETKESFQITGTATISDTCGFDYGNGKTMVVKWDNGGVINGIHVISDWNYDIRYDKRYRLYGSEKAYILHFIRDLYDGKEGYWKATYINVKKG